VSDCELLGQEQILQRLLLLALVTRHGGLIRIEADGRVEWRVIGDSLVWTNGREGEEERASSVSVEVEAVWCVDMEGIGESESPTCAA